MKRLNSFIGLILIFFTAGCATVPVSVNDNIKQGYNFSRVKTMLVLPFVEQEEKFGNRSGIDLNYDSASIMAQNLVSPDMNVMEVSDRSSFDFMLQQNGLSLSGMLAEKDYVRIGELTNVDAVLCGSIMMENAAGKRKCSISVWIFDVRERTTVYSSTAERRDIFGGISASVFKKGLLLSLVQRIKGYTAGFPRKL